MVHVCGCAVANSAGLPHDFPAIEPGEFSNIFDCDTLELAAALTQAVLHKLLLKEVASSNMLSILVTLDTSHLDRS